MKLRFRWTYNNYFVPHEVTTKDGKTKKKVSWRDRKKGKWVFDEKTKKPVLISSLDQLIGEQFKSENLFLGNFLQIVYF